MAKNYEVMDGNAAAAYISYAFTEVAGIFPITPSSPMAELVDAWAANGKKNIFGRPVDVVEMQSEGGAAGTVHGSLQSGALTTTYTASQGLLLMVPNMYKIAGEFLPGVFHVSARTLSAHALSIFGDHSDVMSCRMTGFAMLASSSPQEVMDMGAVAHLAAISGRLPFLHFFDGFRTSHEMQKIATLDYYDMKSLVDMEALKAFRKNSLNPDHPATRGTTVNPDIFFQSREGCNEKFSSIPDIVEKYMNEINKLTGKNYKLFDYYGDENTEYLIVAMGSVSDTIKETVDYLISEGKKVGMINIHLYRPFSAKHFLAAVPKSVKKIAVLDRTKEPGSLGEPLYQDLCSLYYHDNSVEIIGGRYGLSSKDTTPGQIVSVFENLMSNNPKNNFTIGINDDVTFTSLPVTFEPVLNLEGLTSCKIWGMGSDGTVGANKNSIKIIGNSTDLYSQAYFVYDSKKSGGLTQSHLRFGKEAIRSPYLVNQADFVAVHNPSYVDKYDLVKDLKEGGIFLLNCGWSLDELDTHLPADMKKALYEKKTQFYTIDAIFIAKELGLGGRTNTVLQSAFFKLANIMPIDVAIREMKDAIYKTYYVKKGQAVVDMNYAAVEKGLEGINKIEIPEKWASSSSSKQERKDLPEFIREVVMPMNRQEGDSLPVSIIKKHNLLDGTWHAGTTKYEKRGAAVEVPCWDKSKCIQCNQCALVCPHAAIRPVLADADELQNSPSGFVTVDAKGKDLQKYQYRMQVSPYDCTGCGSCANVCPVKEKALVMKPFETQVSEAENWEFGIERVSIKKDAVSNKNIKSSQFAKPYFEFSGACAGCGETPYIKLATQLFGDRMYIANASGCSSAYGGSSPSTPYCKDCRGKGPAWAMSLFEDNAEYAFGYLLGHESIKKQIKDKVAKLEQVSTLKEACQYYLENSESAENSEMASEQLIKAIKNTTEFDPTQKDCAEFILNNSEFMSKKSVWAFGGDGWAYDIGYGGLDHVLASGKDINVLVLDTEVYSNTGGQSSKATSAAAIAKFAAGGKEVKKKDLGMMAMTYGYVYVAQVSMGYDQAQTLKALREAESYPGPSIVIAYSPCIEHGLKRGMGKSQEEMKRAVESGYWHLYRYNPLLKEEGKNPFILDSKPPTMDLKEFLRTENRYAALELSFPEKSEALFNKAERDARERYESYLKLAEE